MPRPLIRQSCFAAPEGRKNNSDNFPKASALARSTIFATAGAGFVDDDLGKHGQFGSDALPQPLRQHFAGGIFQARNLVEAAMIDLFVNRIDDGLDLAVIDQIVLAFRDFAFDDDVDLERMSMHPPALVAL